MDRINTICVFGGSNLGKDGEFQHAASTLGKALAARKINLVYGGGIQGLKGCVAGSALTKGCNVLGVGLKNGGTSYFTLGTELKVATMHDRMRHMLVNSNAFIALPGGLGTMEEIFTIIFWAYRNFHKKPLGLLNINGFYNGLISFLDHAVEQEFMPQSMRNIIVSASTVEQLLEILQNPTSELSQAMQLVNQPNQDGRDKREPDTTLRL